MERASGELSNEGGQVTLDDCPHCGEHPASERCAWAETCDECERTDVDMARDRLCLDCQRKAVARAKKERLSADSAARGDWMRDQQR